MLNHLKDTANVAYTENGAVTKRTSGSDCLDLFATIGAMRALNSKVITHMTKALLSRGLRSVYPAHLPADKYRSVDKQKSV